MSAVIMRQRIEAALAAAAVPLGTYTLPGGEQVPALSLGDAPAGTTVEGLECVIATNPKQIPPTTFCYPGMPRAYYVRLINNDDEADVIDVATSALAAAFWPFEDEPVLTIASSENPEYSTFSLNFYPIEE